MNELPVKKKVQGYELLSFDLFLFLKYVRRSRIELERSAWTVCLGLNLLNYLVCRKDGNYSVISVLRRNKFYSVNFFSAFVWLQKELPYRLYI